MGRLGTPSAWPGALLCLLAVLTSLMTLSQPAAATGLTYVVPSGSEKCFHADVPEAGRKVSIYFAVQTGGSFEVNYHVSLPNGRVLIDGTKAKQNEFVFVAQEPGEHTLCLANPTGMFSSEAEKAVDFEIVVERQDSVAKLPSKPGSSAEQASVIEDSLMKLSGLVGTVQRNLRYFRTRENRNFSTVSSTGSRMVTLSLTEIGYFLLLLGIAAGQIVYLFRVRHKVYV